jgi:hypothetical protein
MKNIKLEFSFSPQKKYKVHIGHCEWLQFKSKRFAKAFLAKYKSLLTDNVRSLITYQIQVNQLHKIFYFEYDVKTNRHITNEIKNFEKQLPFIFQQYSEGNANAFVFQTISYCIASLLNATDLMYDHSLKYKNYALKNQCRSLIKILYDFEKSFDYDVKNLNVNFDYRNSVSPLKCVINKTA